MRTRSSLAILASLAMLFIFISGCAGGNQSGGQAGNGSSGSGSSGGGSTTQPTVTSVTVSCASTSVSVEGSVQCSAVVNGANNPSQSVNWSVNAISGGNGTVGTISSSGQYTAPANVPSPADVTVTATSAVDSSKSASSSLTVTLSIKVSPSSANVQLFHTEQFTADVAGVSNTAVQWEVNGTVGGTSISGTISTTGLYTPPVVIPATSSVTITAVSQADSTQSASAQVALVKDSTTPAVVSTSPVAGAVAVSVQPSIQIVFNEALDPNSITASSFNLTSGSTQQQVEIGYNSSTYTVTLLPTGMLTPGASYSVQVAQTVQDLGGNPIAAPYSFGFQVQAPTSITGAATYPQGVDPTTAVVSSFRGQQSVPDSSGNFSGTISNQGTTLIGSSLSAQGSALLAVAISSSSSSASSTLAAQPGSAIRTVHGVRTLLQPGKAAVYLRPHQITASTAALSTSSSVVMNFQTTAEALLFYSPALMQSDPQAAAQTLTDIAADPNTAALATVLSTKWNEASPMQDPTVITAYDTALQSVLQTVIAQASTTPQAQVQFNSRQERAKVEATSSTSQSNNAPLIYPIHVCCVNMPPFSADGTNFTSNFGVQFGRASGWFMRIVQMPSSFSPTQLQPANGSTSSPDSPDPISDEDQQGIAPPAWLPGNSIFQYGDLLGDLQQITSSVVSDITGTTPATSANVVLPASPSAYYLVRFYSGGTGDSYEMPLVSGGADSIYDGPELWRSAMANNDISVAVDLINATNLIPQPIVSCETTDLLPQIPTIVSSIGTSNQGWSTFEQVSGTVWGSFTSNFGSCFSSNALGNVFDMLADAAKLASVSSIVDGINSVSQASDAIQIVTEQEFESPVDTALIQVISSSGGTVANITFSPSSLTLSTGGTETITATAYDSSNNTISNPSLTWSIGNPAIATVSGSGNSVQVKGIAAGTTQLTAKAASGFTAYVPITVSATTSGPMVGGVAPNPVPPSNSAQKLTINGSNFQNGATLTYYDTSNKSYSGITTTFVSSGQLVDPAFNNASDIGSWKVVVVNPDGTTSPAYTFSVAASTSTPTVSSVAPNPVPPSSSAQKL
ncbi:MAG: Ig-like domain-containing protein, partial [Nitrososphaerota archaeon]|nr:Ig-like domain-containing protein [Nitrososphaerota archaeon]